MTADVLCETVCPTRSARTLTTLQTSLDVALESSSQGIRAVKISLVALGLTSLAQLAQVVISGSVALLADTTS